MQYKEINGKSNKELGGCGIAGTVGEQKTVETLGGNFFNYTVSHIRANGVPLSYIIRDNEEPFALM